MHPQHWPEDLDTAGQRVVVIGSGATAVTLVPALADAGPARYDAAALADVRPLAAGHDPVAQRLRGGCPSGRRYGCSRWKNIGARRGASRSAGAGRRSRSGCSEGAAAKRLPEGYRVDAHFKPRYDPWDQRLCLVPGRRPVPGGPRGTRSIVTDTIDTFTEKGVRLASGEELVADVVVTATGLNLKSWAASSSRSTASRSTCATGWPTGR